MNITRTFVVGKSYYYCETTAFRCASFVNHTFLRAIITYFILLLQNKLFPLNNVNAIMLCMQNVCIYIFYILFSYIRQCCRFCDFYFIPVLILMSNVEHQSFNSINQLRCLKQRQLTGWPHNPRLSTVSGCRRENRERNFPLAADHQCLSFC